MKEFVTAGKTAGVVTLVARHGQVASLEAVGYQDLESKTPMRTDTIFRIASVTKPVTCAAIMILVDEGRLSLIDPVEKFLPEFKGLRLNPCGTRGGYNCELVTPSRPVNLLDLMTHTSGLADGGAGTRQRRPPRWPNGSLGVSRATLIFEPGTAWNYSNLGIAALGRIIEVVTGQPFDQFLAERIFQPLAMTDTFFFVPPDKEKRVASVYRYEADGLKLVPCREPKFPGAGGRPLQHGGRHGAFPPDAARTRALWTDSGFSRRPPWKR